MILFGIERGIAMSHLYVDNQHFTEEEKLVVDRFAMIFSAELTTNSIKELNNIMAVYDPEGWIKLDFAFDLLEHDDKVFRNFYKEDIMASRFVDLNGFELYSKVENLYVNEMDKENDLDFREDLNSYIDIKRIEYLLSHQFYNHGLDVEVKVENFLKDNQFNDYLEFEKPIMDKGFNRL